MPANIICGYFKQVTELNQNVSYPKIKLNKFDISVKTDYIVKYLKFGT